MNAFSETETLRDSHIQYSQTGARNAVPAVVAERPRCWNRICCWIEEGNTSGWRRRDAGLRVAHTIRIPGTVITAIGETIIRPADSDRKWNAALGDEGTGEPPSAHD